MESSDATAILGILAVLVGGAGAYAVGIVLVGVLALGRLMLGAP
jgi:hypothetical protein